jgi:DNA repair exonuclease SbcCD ATPase subunit
MKELFTKIGEYFDTFFSKIGKIYHEICGADANKENQYDKKCSLRDENKENKEAIIQAIEPLKAEICGEDGQDTLRKTVLDSSTTISEILQYLQNEVKDIKGENSKLKDSNTKLKIKTSNLETEKSGLEQAHSKLKTEKDDLDKIHSELDKAHSKLKDSNTKLKIKTSNLETEKSGLEQAHSELKTEKDDLEQAHFELKNENNALQDKVLSLSSWKLVFNNEKIVCLLEAILNCPALKQYCKDMKLTDSNIPQSVYNLLLKLGSAKLFIDSYYKSMVEYKKTNQEPPITDDEIKFYAAINNFFGEKVIKNHDQKQVQGSFDKAKHAGLNLEGQGSIVDNAILIPADATGNQIKVKLR